MRHPIPLPLEGRLLRMELNTPEGSTLGLEGRDELHAVLVHVGGQNPPKVTQPRAPGEGLRAEAKLVEVHGGILRGEGPDDVLGHFSANLAVPEGVFELD